MPIEICFTYITYMYYLFILVTNMNYNGIKILIEKFNYGCKKL
jgi:hypothetical protein